MNVAMVGLFEGVKVLEIGQFVAAPIAAELLAHGGADVIKIEPVTGDGTRSTDPIAPGEGRQYVVKARGKRAMPLDLGSAEGRKIALTLAVRSDVFITNLRPGTAERLGLGYDDLHTANPALVYGEISGFGDAGPNAGRPSLDLIAQAWTGLRVGAGTSQYGELGHYESYFCDYTAGLLLAFGIAAALRHREITGEGQRVGTSLAHAGLFMQHRNASLFDRSDQWKRDLAANADGLSLSERARLRAVRVAPDVFFMTTYDTSDGAIVIGAPGPMAATFCRLMDVTDPRTTDAWADRAHRSILLAEVREAIGTKLAALTTAEAFELVTEAGLPASPVRLLEEMLVDQAAIEGGLLYEAEHPRLGTFTMPAAPLTLSGTDYRARTDTAAFGQHTDAVLRELGYDDATIERLVADQIVSRG